MGFKFEKRQELPAAGPAALHAPLWLMHGKRQLHLQLLDARVEAGQVLLLCRRQLRHQTGAHLSLQISYISLMLLYAGLHMQQFCSSVSFPSHAAAEWSWQCIAQLLCNCIMNRCTVVDIGWTALLRTDLIAVKRAPNSC